MDSLSRSALDKADKKAAPALSVDTSASPAAALTAPVDRHADVLSLSDVSQRVKDEPDFDRAKVDAIKQAIAQGQYPLNPRRIAESFVAIEQMIRD